MIKKLPLKVEQELEDLLEKHPILNKIILKIDQAGGVPYLVGGAVRDLFLGAPVKDIDVEVHSLSLKELSDILSNFDYVDLVGKSFGVLRIHGLDVDWSIPRKDSFGRKPEVELDPNMNLEDAFRRRDLTINSMGINLITKELVDPFGGFQDLEHKLLRATDYNFFIEDPLRFFRVMQFIGRFQFFPDKKLDDICKKITISEVSKERIESEFEKLLLKSKKPSLGIRWLKEIGRLKEVLPELYATIGIDQEPKWHPEGDVFEHTMQTLDEAAKVCQEYELKQFEKLVLMYAALCHDLGKVSTTKKVAGVIKSIGHDLEGVPLAKSLLKRITSNKDLIKIVSLLVRYHMQPLMFSHSNAGAAAYKRLANKLAPYTNLKMLSLLTMADRLGRNKNTRAERDETLESVYAFINKAKIYGVYESVEKPILQGKDLLGAVDPGPKLGNLVRKAYEIQLEKGIKDKNELKKLVLKKAKNH